MNQCINKSQITATDFKLLINHIKEEQNVSGNIWKPIRIAVTSQEHGPDISKFIEILGPQECSNRLKLFIDLNDH